MFWGKAYPKAYNVLAETIPTIQTKTRRGKTKYVLCDTKHNYLQLRYRLRTEHKSHSIVDLFPVCIVYGNFILKCSGLGPFMTLTFYNNYEPAVSNCSGDSSLPIMQSAKELQVKQLNQKPIINHQFSMKYSRHARNK